jgi:acetylglutamate kinase
MIVIKFGGHAMTDKNGDFAQTVKSAISHGVEIVIVHGGGPQIDKGLQQAGLTSEFVGGFRKTTPEIFAVVESVLVEQVGPSVAHRLQSAGVGAQAMSGRRGHTLVAKKLNTLVNGESADLGFVGDVTNVHLETIHQILSEGKIPVIAPIASSEDGDTGFNVNADLAAAAISGALDASALIIMTDVEGIYRNWPDTDSLISEISASDLNALKSTFADGIAPKVQAALDAIAKGSKAVRIIDGTKPSALADALDNHGGTLVRA